MIEKIDEIIKSINSMNEEIKKGERSNPAKLCPDYGDAIIIRSLSEIDKKEVIDLIGEWMYKKESERMKSLNHFKNKKIEELRELLND